MADPDWLACLMSEEYLDTPILNGLQIMQYPENVHLSFWAKESFGNPLNEKEGRFLRSAATNNVRFSTKILDSGLRFNEVFGRTGGGDYLFFAQAKQNGFAIKRTLKAITYEIAHPDRYTYAGQVYRAYWHAATRARCHIILGCSRKISILSTIKNFRRLLQGFASLFISCIALPFSRKYFRRNALVGGKRIAEAVGYTYGLLGGSTEPYKQISGR